MVNELILQQLLQTYQVGKLNNVIYWPPISRIIFPKNVKNFREKKNKTQKVNIKR